MPQYRATQFTLPWDATVGRGNSRGDIVYNRSFEGRQRTFVRTLDGSTTMLPLLPGALATAGVALNDQGAVAVAGFLVGDASRVYTWSGSAGYVQMPEQPGPIDSNQEPTDITNNGVVSWSTSGFLGAGNARGLWNTITDEVRHMPDTAGGHTVIRDLSEGGYAVGDSSWSRFGALYRPDGTSVQLRSSAAYFSSFSMNGGGARVSNNGTAVSRASVSVNGVTTSATYIWDGNGQVIEERINPGFAYTGISGDSLIAGVAGTPNGGSPFLYQIGETRVPLESRILERNFTGELFGTPTAILDNHAVLISQGGGGVGIPRSYVFLTPVPEPGTVLALGAGLAALLRCRRAS